MSAPDAKNILLIEDTVPLARVYTEYMRAESYHVIHVETGEAALAELAASVPDAVVLDLKLPDMDGLDILRHIREQAPDTSVVVITAHGSVNTAVEAMRQGAFDFIVKPFNAARLNVTLRNALERKKLTRIVEVYRKNLDRDRFYDFIGASTEMDSFTPRRFIPISATRITPIVMSFHACTAGGRTLNIWSTPDVTDVVMVRT